MKKVLIIGSGISGLSAATYCAAKGIEVTLVSPYSPERAQSVMASGGINGVLSPCESGDSIESHIEDTLEVGCFIAGKEAVKGLCENASDIIKWLERLGTVFSVDSDDNIRRRAFGGQSHNRTCYAGTSTGKQIVTALVMEVRRYEMAGLITRRNGLDFYKALIRDGICYGAVLYNEIEDDFELIQADFVIVASGGQNALFGKTTGSILNDGYVAGKLFMQGVELKNLEFIQYHPTTIDTTNKHMLVSEAVRGEGGRLYYTDNGNRVYFMEDKYGAKGNLMPRDVVSRCIEETGRDVYLDITFLGKKEILRRIPEVYDLCMKYKGVDISKESIKVEPSVHFFMGGIAVNNKHETSVHNLYAIGECASIYHGANRLGSNSLLAAVYSGKVAGESIRSASVREHNIDFSDELNNAKKEIEAINSAKGTHTISRIRDELATVMKDDLGIIRNGKALQRGIDKISEYQSCVDKLDISNNDRVYDGYSLKAILALAKATLICAESRKESRGAHYRSDYADTDDKCKASTIISYNGGKYSTYLDLEKEFEK